MLVRIIKPIPDTPTVVEQGVVYDQNGVKVVDYCVEAAPVQYATADIIVESVKVGEQPLYREPTHEELVTRNADATYIAAMSGDGTVNELKKPNGFEMKIEPAGWRPKG